MSDTNQRPWPAFDFPAMTRRGMALQKKSIEIYQKNTELTLEYMRALLAARTPSDCMQITREFTERQITAFQDQAQTLTEIASGKE